MVAKDIFNEIKDLEGLKKYTSDTSDGESAYIECKAVSIDLRLSQPSDIGDFKLKIAKEMSAFANTDSGVIAVGVDTNLEIDNKTLNLEDWLDKNIKDMIEPNLMGIEMKTCRDSEDDKFVLLYIPKGDVIPYRVSSVRSSNRNKRYLREYYQRSGSNSLPIPISIVRSLYLSNERAIDLNIDVSLKLAKNPTNLKSGEIQLSIVVKPDSIKFIKDYYLESNIFILDSNFRLLHSTPIDIMPIVGSNAPIPPAESCIELSEFSIKSSKEIKQSPYDFPLDIVNVDNEKQVPEEKFNKVFAIYAITKYACDGFPLKKNKQLFILGEDKDLSLERYDELKGYDASVFSWEGAPPTLASQVNGFIQDAESNKVFDI